MKFGGNAMVSPELQRAFAEDMVYLRYAGIRPVVVHGGGPQISSMLDRLAIPSEFKGGYRVTSTEAISVVRMVLTGQINPQLVAKINAHGPHAAGLSGEDAGLFGGRRRGVVIEGVEHDLGRVGDVVEVDPQPVLDQLAAGRIPVVSSIAPDLDHPGHSLNVNADDAASALAIGLRADRLLFVSDVPGVLVEGSVAPRLSSAEADSLLSAGAFEGGIVPKLMAAVRAARLGVPASIGATEVLA